MGDSLPQPILSAPRPDAPTTAPLGPPGALGTVLMLVERWRLLFGGSLAVGCVALALSFLIAPTFTATARLLPPSQQGGLAGLLSQQLGAIASIAGSAVGVKNPTDQYIALLRSDNVADRIIDQFGLREVYDVEYLVDARKALASGTLMTAGKDGLIVISVDDRDPGRAAAIANAFAAELQRLTRQMTLGEASQRRAFFEKQLATARDGLVRAESALSASGIGAGTVKAEPRVAVEATARLAAAITVAEVRLATLGGYLAEGHPDLVVARRELDALRAQRARLQRSDPAAVSGDGADYIARFRDFKYNETLFELMARQYELARIEEAREGSSFVVIDEAQPPERKSRPKKALLAMLATAAAFTVIALWLVVRRALAFASRDAEFADALARIGASRRLRGG
jgi:uncharacterized protein involved in exopolysaccharide biosynthesis